MPITPGSQRVQPIPATLSEVSVDLLHIFLHSTWLHVFAFISEWLILVPLLWTMDDKQAKTSHTKERRNRQT